MRPYSLFGPNIDFAGSLLRNVIDISANALYRGQQRSSKHEGQPRQSIKHETAPLNGGNLPSSNAAHNLSIDDLGSHIPFGHIPHKDTGNPVASSACHNSWSRHRVIKLHICKAVPTMHSEQRNCRNHHSGG